MLLLISACNKNGGLLYTGSKIATKKNCLQNLTYTYNYNSDGSIANITMSNGGKTVYTYIGDSILEQTYNGANIFTSGMVYHIVGNKVVDTAWGLLQAAATTTSYQYTSAYFLMTQNSYNYKSLKTIDQYNMVGNNLSWVQHNTIAGNSITYDYYVYLSAYSNSLGNQSTGMDFLGVQNANLPSTDIKIANSDTTDIITYRYRFDTSSRPDTTASYHRSGSMIDSFIYTYY
jgi:hypothetical protein